jgi:hypothetical protein
VDFINDSRDSVVSLSLAAPGSESWKPVQLSDGFNASDIGGGYPGNTLLALPPERGCTYDVLVAFRRTKPLRLNAVNVCNERLHIGKAWRQAHLRNG